MTRFPNIEQIKEPDNRALRLEQAHDAVGRLRTLVARLARRLSRDRDRRPPETLRPPRWRARLAAARRSAAALRTPTTRRRIHSGGGFSTPPSRRRRSISIGDANENCRPAEFTSTSWVTTTAARLSG